MTEFIEEAELQKFLKASSYVQEFTRRLLARNSRNPSKVPENLESISELSTQIKRFLKEQQDFAATVEKIYISQKQLAEFIRNKLSKCQCETKLDVESIIPPQLNLQEVKKDNGSPYSLKLPTTPSADLTAQLNQALEAETRQPIDLNLLRMIESVNSHTFVNPQNDLYHQLPHTSNQQHHHENGFLNMTDPHNFFDSPSTSSPPNSEKQRKMMNGGKASAKKRPHEVSMIGPYPCRFCDKTFRQKHGLSQHLLTHEATGAFECDGCGKRYSRQESVYRHQRSTQCCAKYLQMPNGHDAGTTVDPKSNLQQLFSFTT
ncbi:unnamed protein product [Caenorhabditis brenneri]